MSDGLAQELYDDFMSTVEEQLAGYLAQREQQENKRQALAAASAMVAAGGRQDQNVMRAQLVYWYNQSLFMLERHTPAFQKSYEETAKMRAENND
jgi:hypothetical protein